MENIDFQMGMSMKAWQNPFSFANEYSGQIKLSTSAFYGKDVTNDTLDVMDENILKCALSKNSLAFRLAIELSNMSTLCLLHYQT